MNQRYQRYSDNAVGQAIRWVAIATVIFGIGVGISNGRNLYGEFSFWLALQYWGFAIGAGTLLEGFSEIIFLLDSIFRQTVSNGEGLNHIFERIGKDNTK